MANEGLDCAFSLLVNDSHRLTNETLPIFAEEFAQELGLANITGLPLASCFPYTNVYMARPGFFRMRHISRILRAAVLEPDFYINRWGDHVMLGVPLNLFSTNERVQPIAGLRYDHDSHSTVITANDDLRARYATTLAGIASLAPIERFADWPLSHEARSAAADAMVAAGHPITAERLMRAGP